MNPSKNRAPAFQFYADDFISGVADMTDEEVGLYVRLLCAQWSRGSLPNDTEELLRFSRGSTTLQAERVRRKFEVCPDGQLRNARLEAEREKQAAWREKSRVGGQKSGVARSLMKGGSTILPPPYEPKGNSPSPSPSPLGDGTDHACESDPVPVVPGSSSTQVNPTMEEAKAFAERNGHPAECAEKWFLDHDARGWADRAGQPIVRWHSSLLSYAVQWRANAQRDSQRAKGGATPPPRAPRARNFDPSNPQTADV